MSDIVLMLRLEHAALERVLACFERHVDALAAGTHVEPSFLSTIIDWMRAFPDACHHPKEELVYAKLAERSGQAAAAVGDLLAEHAERAAETRRLADLFCDGRMNAPEDRQRAIEAAHRFIAAQRRHIRLEEVHFFPAAMAHLAPEDWEDIDFEVFDTDEPLFREGTEEHLRTLRNAILHAEIPVRRASGHSRQL